MLQSPDQLVRQSINPSQFLKFLNMHLPFLPPCDHKMNAIPNYFTFTHLLLPSHLSLDYRYFGTQVDCSIVILLSASL
ncbi:predicted protein [Lichtheimia corymbifera JMRC:FSU:9682]|uniref:Uncharacterized protein n=1 Tax=Lichtheimia corymbifera JMRC:FSU:9682 TaxID=1263082 RepID=A0A068S0H0_9FUNG|nr:predicted protein [Lichtheimia corymbifera JMRC:FSU:9682]